MKRKTRFECGHYGFGKSCHLCKQIKNNELIQFKDKYYTPKQLEMIK